MSNNLVSQQLSIQSIQMGQLEHISNKLDSSMQMGLMKPGINNPALQQVSIPNVQMGMTEPGSIDALSQQTSVSNNQAPLLEPMPNNHVLQKLSVSTMQMGQMKPQTYNPEQFLLPNKQVGEMETMSNNVKLQQSSTLSKRKAPMESTFSNPASPMSSVSNKRVAQMEHRPWLQQISAPNKLPVQVQSISNASGSQRSQTPSKRSAPNKTGPQQLSAQKNQTGRMQSSLKVQNESFESVRSKLRQSLTDALALVSQKQHKMSSVGKTAQSEAENASGKTQISSQPLGHTSGASDAVDSMSEEAKESSPTKDDSLADNCCDGQNMSQETSADGNAGDSTQTSKNDGQELQSGVILHDEYVSFSDNFFVKDELLQGNGLAWVLEPATELAEKKDFGITQNQPDQKDVGGEQVVQAPQIVASKIEEELFKLFGGVNKKYKEKGRSLIFNLKDRNNPELRERVMSGEIPPERLCSMTAEELASKELSEWRMAKAEELAQMVVLPDSDVDIRRLVKKTHKGEFQVEVEQPDSVSLEVAVGASSLTQMRPKSDEKEASLPSKPDERKDTVNVAGDKSNSEVQEVPCTFTIPSNEGTDLMQGLMVDDELKDAEFLPPIVSLDEFMESLNSEPPFENLPVDAGKTTPISDKDDSQVASESKSPDVTTKDPDDTTPAKSDDIVTRTKSDADGKSIDSHVESETTAAVSVPKGEHVWEGVLQLNISAMASVVGIFKSGDKTSAKEWSGFIEIKGRVRLDAFEKFLQDLPMSRSRAVMAVHFVCKEGSSESERTSLSEVADSYVLDERVGLAEPAPGVELYLCPPHSKAREMLIKVLPRDQVHALNAIDNGLIGVIVWRKAQITSTISPNSASHHKHNSKRQHVTSRRHHEKDTTTTNTNVNVTSKHPLPRGGPTSHPNPQPDDDDDDVPPGFGPPAARDEDDLPEFNFSSGSITPRPRYPNQKPIGGPGMASLNPDSPTPSRPVDQMRELIHRYGQPGTNASSGNWHDKRGIGPAVQSWNNDDDDDDDDMPEWHPDETQYQRAHTQPVQVHGLQQPMVQANVVQQLAHQPMAPLGTSPAMPLHPQMNVMHGPSWQQGTWVVPTAGTHGLPAYQLNGGQLYGASGLGAGQQGMGWRTDAPTSRGY